MNDKELAEKIIQYVGGKENILSLTHCVTRLRFNLKNNDIVDTKGLDSLADVMGSQYQGGQYQVIIGGKVGKVYAEIIHLMPELSGSDHQPDQDSGKKESLVNRLINTLSAILVPSLAPIIGGGMLKGFLFLFTNLNWLTAESETYFVLNIIGDCMFYFFPFLIAVSAAKRFKTNEYLALSLAGALMYPTLLNAATAGEVASIHFLGIFPVPMIDYSASIVPIILSVWILSHVYRFWEKHIPSMVTIIFTPLLTLTIMIPVMLVAIAPLGFYIGEYVAVGVQWLIDFSPLLAGFIIGATRPALVLMGMHHAIRPITVQQISTYGYSTMGPMNFMSTMAQATAAFAIYFLVKDKKMRQVSMSATISGYLGITEPALYGVLVKYKSAFIGASLGGGIGAAVGAMMNAQSYAPAMPSVISIPVFLGKYSVGFFVAFAVTIAATFIITFMMAKFFMRKDFAANHETVIESDAPAGSTVTVEGTAIYDVFSPVDGEIYPMNQVPDKTFSSEVIGKGVAIHPNKDEIVSPVNGEISAVFQDNHAIGLTSEDGVEVLIHVGIDTVNLGGKFFEPTCEQGQHVAIGDPLLKFDRKKIEDAGYDSSVLVLVTNSKDFLSVEEEFDSGKIFEQEKVLNIIK